MRIAIYPGSFNPWHEGHQDVLEKTLSSFDKVIIAIGINPEKDTYTSGAERIPDYVVLANPNVSVCCFKGLLVDFIHGFNSTPGKGSICAVVRGLRNGVDLEYEKTQQYWNEDLGIKVPTVCFITDRKLVHISSSALRMINKLKKGDT